MNGKTLLEAADLCKEYGPQNTTLLSKRGIVIRAVDGVSFKVRRKNHLSIVGESGSGKTTLARMLTGLIAPTSGSIFFRDVDIAKLKTNEMRPLRRFIQIVFQDPYSSLNPRMSVGEAVERPMQALNVADGEKRKEHVKELLEAVGLSGYDRSLPSELSGGQRQRVALARSLSVNPELVILDEPTSALDVSIQAQIVNLLKKIEDEFETTFILITHNIALIQYLTVETAVMHHGKIVEMNDTRTLLSNPQHPYTQRLLASVPVPDPNSRRPSP